MTGNFGRCLCLGVDARGYGSATDRVQAHWQQALLESLDLSASRAGLDRPQWKRQAKGDEELALLPDDGTEPVVVDDFVHELDGVLTRYNQANPVHRLRLRLALHHGVAYPGANGMPGQAVVLMSRLLNSRPIHEALDAVPEANLAVIISQRIYEDVVVQEHTSLTAKDFRRVKVVEKELDTEAWLRVPGADVHALDLPSNPVATRPGHSDNRPTGVDDKPMRNNGPVFHQNGDTQQTFTGQIDASHAHFGAIYGRGQDE
jgi:hypothetical protein